MKKKHDERDVIYEVLLAFNALSLKLPIYYDLLKFVDDRKYLDALVYLSEQRKKGNISKSTYEALLFVLRSADLLWSEMYSDFSSKSLSSLLLAKS